MGALQTFEASLRHAVRERQAATVGGGRFTYQELKEVLGEIEALRNAKTQQPQAGVLAQMLQPGGVVPIDVETTAMLVVEITRQHAAIERKDALLRQALAALKRAYGYGTTLVDNSTSDAIDAITKELQ